MTATTIQLSIRRFFTCDEGQFYLVGQLTIQSNEIGTPETAAKLQELHDELLQTAKEDPRPMTDLREMTTDEVAIFIDHEKAQRRQDELLSRLMDALANGEVTAVDISDEAVAANCKCGKCADRLRSIREAFSPTQQTKH